MKDLEGIFIAVAALIISLMLGYAILTNYKPKIAPIDPCAPSHSVIIDGVWKECTDSPTNYRGTMEAKSPG